MLMASIVFDSLSLKFISVTLNFRKQKTKVGSTFSDYLNIVWCSARIYSFATFFQCLHLRYVQCLHLRAEPRKTKKLFAKYAK